MEQTLQALAGILLKAIPTIVLVLILHFYLKSMLFRPLEKILKLREDATGGARKSAEASFELAEAKAAEYENAIRAARSDVFREQEQVRLGLVAEQDARLHDARKQIEAMIQNGRAQIAKETAAAKQSLGEQTSALADQIATTILPRRAS
jgi:F-type H+-transporting ATPase subunit b